MTEAYIWNTSEEHAENGYSPNLFLDLFSRFENPAAENHWERLFFRIETGPAEVYEENRIISADDAHTHSLYTNNTINNNIDNNNNNNTHSPLSSSDEEEEEEVEPTSSHSSSHNTNTNPFFNNNNNNTNTNNNTLLGDALEGVDDEEWSAALRSVERIEELRAKDLSMKKDSIAKNWLREMGV